MDKAAFDARYGEYRDAVEAFLDGLFADKPHWADLYDAMRYSLLAGGKRIRPVLTLEFARLSGMDWHKALPVACALELVHTYSLIHDDLPCMDNDDLLLVNPTNHKVYGETLAVLAGDALQPEAFRLILTAPDLDAARRADCALILAKAAGADGMVAGQVLDTLHEPHTQGVAGGPRLKTEHDRARHFWLRSRGSGEGLRPAAANYAQQVGVAFQIRDDMLDVVAMRPLSESHRLRPGRWRQTYVDVRTGGLRPCVGCYRAARRRWAGAGA